MTTVLLDTHVLQWWSAEPDRLSSAAAEALYQQFRDATLTPR